MAERLAVDISRIYETGWLGKKGDDTFPCTGSQITRVEFHKEVSKKDINRFVPGLGQGNVYTSDTQLPDIGVHYWLDAGTRLKYILKVWVED